VISTPIDATRLLLRLGLGLIFLFSGMQKVLPGTAATVAYFSELGIPWSELLGPLVSYLELFGAILLIAGVLTRLVSALFICEMLVALLVARLPMATVADSVADAFASVRLEVLMAIVASCLVLLGGGRWSLDSVARRVRHHSEAAEATVAGLRRN
jgi:putative oxidoreductase